ncbi:hypothetical protein SprV_0301004600 [Sparganum proliferum]
MERRLGRCTRSRQDRIPDTDLLERTGIFSIYAMLRQLQLRSSGHLVRMDDERLFYGDIGAGSRRQEGQVRLYKETLKTSLKRLQINPSNWEDLVRDQGRLAQRSTKPTALLPHKPNAKHTSLSCVHLAMPTHNRLKRVHGVNGHSGRQMDLLDTFRSTTPLGPHQPSPFVHLSLLVFHAVN